MAKKKKKFGLDDALELTAHAATLLGNFKDAQSAAKKSKESTSFDKGNATNLKGAQAGVSTRKPPNTDYGVSQLNKRYRNTP